MATQIARPLGHIHIEGALLNSRNPKQQSSIEDGVSLRRQLRNIWHRASPIFLTQELLLLVYASVFL